MNNGKPPYTSFTIAMMTRIFHRSNDYYPDLYCGCIEATETACFEQNIIELWGDQVKHCAAHYASNTRSQNCVFVGHYLQSLQCFQGHYNEKSWKKIESLTEEEILDTINHKNVSGIFLKDFNFSELLGDIKYDEHGRIIGELMDDIIPIDDDW